MRRLAADLERFLERLPDHKPDPLASGGRDGPPMRHARSTRREQLERYVDAMSATQRLRLAGALHLLSRRLDEDLADPNQRAGTHAG